MRRCVFEGGSWTPKNNGNRFADARLIGADDTRPSHKSLVLRGGVDTETRLKRLLFRVVPKRNWVRRDGKFLYKS